MWFHVDALSSAHVYLRMPRGWTWGRDPIPSETLEDCCQLVKANSIAGCKQPTVAIVYTPSHNLKKTAAMDVGQVSFKDQGRVKREPVIKRDQAVVNRLNRTKREVKKPDLEGERNAREREVRSLANAQAQKEREEEQKAADEARREKEYKSYDRLMDPESMVTGSQLKETYGTAEDYEDNFL